MGHRPHFRPIKRCIFCQQKAKSGEHGWSEWAVRDLAFQGGIIGAVDEIPYNDSAQKHLKVRCVCVPCNTIWMKRLEDAIRPTIGRMMFDAVMDLDIHQQWAITQWAIKTSMVFEHINRKTDIFYTAEERSLLRTTGDIPPHTAAWIARADGDISFFTRGSYGFAGDESAGGQSRDDDCVSTVRRSGYNRSRRPEQRRLHPGPTRRPPRNVERHHGEGVADAERRRLASGDVDCARSA